MGMVLPLWTPRKDLRDPQGSADRALGTSGLEFQFSIQSSALLKKIDTLGAVERPALFSA